MSARSLLFGALVSLLASSCATPRAPPHSLQASDFDAAIARLRQTDPASPALLNAQLAYGEFLLSKAEGPCAQRLVLAQEQLGSVAASPKTHTLYPDGWARAADLEYRLHLARADCDKEADRHDDLLTAAAAARRAVELYRNEFDYRSMVIMQFDVAAVLHRMGETTAALAALESALDMDREFGFADDARQNTALWLAWRGEPAGAAQVAALMRDFPQRQAILKFGWHPAAARMTFASRRAYLEDGRIVRSRAGAAFERRIAASHGGGWTVSYQHRLAHYDPGVWLSDPGPQRPSLVLPATALAALDFRVSATGDLQEVTGSQAFAARLTARTNALIRAGAHPADRARSTMDEATDKLSVDFSPGLLEAETAQSYQLETAMWIGAKLEQGVWYEMSAPLSLPGMPQFVVQQQIVFAFTRMAPCTAGASTQTCVEIVLHATPDKKAVADVRADLSDVDATFSAYDAATEVRIIVDPATLLPYEHDEQIHWYASVGSGPGDALLESERSTSTASYGAH